MGGMEKKLGFCQKNKNLGENRLLVPQAPAAADVITYNKTEPLWFAGSDGKVHKEQILKKPDVSAECPQVSWELCLSFCIPQF